MKALSVRQPWASLIAGGYKTIEWRPWQTRYRGPILICSGKAPDDIYFEFDLIEAERKWPLGVAVAVVELADIRPFDPARDIRPAMLEKDFAPERPGFSWVLKDPFEVLGKIPIRGQQGLFEVEFTPPAP